MVAVSSTQGALSNNAVTGAGSSGAAQVQEYAQSNLASSFAGNATTIALSNMTSGITGTAPGDTILQSMQQTRQVDVINPQGLTSSERLSDSTPVGTAYGADMGSPDNLGSSLNDVLEGVHEKTTTYEQNGISTDSSPENTVLSQERDSLKPNNPILAPEAEKGKSLNDQVNSQVNRYTDMMRNGYEYYIFTSLTIDVGKDVSQTASTLTKG